MAGADYTEFDRNMDKVRSTGKPPVAVIPKQPEVSEEKDPRATSIVVGKQGDATVVQHRDGKDSAVGETGLQDLGITKP